MDSLFSPRGESAGTMVARKALRCYPRRPARRKELRDDAARLAEAERERPLLGGARGRPEEAW
jgi:hypothetical protein